MKRLDISTQNIIRLEIVGKQLYCYHQDGMITSHNIVGLAELDCENNLLTTLPDLSSLTSLTNLYCRSNLLTHFTNLPKNLTCLSCGYNNLVLLPRMSHIQLEDLFCANNPLRELPLLPDTLKYFSCDNLIPNPLPESMSVCSTLSEEDKNFYLLQRHNQRCRDLGIKEADVVPDLETRLAVKEQHILKHVLRIDGEMYQASQARV